jgi:hypothetical protein
MGALDSFAVANARYEAALRERFGPAVVEQDLAYKHKRMQGSAFRFLRGTCFRWAQTASQLCPEFSGCAVTGSVGDAHAGNFGLWRDARARLVWGVNDFDEAALLPWPLDLVRLLASLVLGQEEVKLTDLAEVVAEGYDFGLANPTPLVLEGNQIWLRRAFSSSPRGRSKFWAAIAEAPAECPPKALATPLIAAAQGVEPLKIAPRRAGMGSLGRPRYVASGWWLGGPIAWEAKGAMPSCFAGAREDGLAQALAHGRFRAAEPSLVYADSHVLRRLAPDSRKLRFEELREHFGRRLGLEMAREIGTIHAQRGDAAAIGRDRDHIGAKGLAAAARRVAEWTEQEWRDWRGTV